jgi:PEP-CTERM motif
MKKLLLTGTILSAFGVAPAHAILQISISDGASTFSCQDGQLGCDLGGAANNILTLNTTVGDFLVFGTLSFSSFGTTNQLSLSSFGIVNQGDAEGTLKILVSDTNFVAPVSSITSSASLTFNNDVGAGASSLAFWADPANVQGANPNNTPGTNLFTTSGTPTSTPDSFSGTIDTAFSAIAPFSMTEGSSIDLLAGASLTGYNQDMVSSFNAVPEPRTWALALAGFAFLAAAGWKRRQARFAI